VHSAEESIYGLYILNRPAVGTGSGVPRRSGGEYQFEVIIITFPDVTITAENLGHPVRASAHYDDKPAMGDVAGTCDEASRPLAADLVVPAFRKHSGQVR